MTLPPFGPCICVIFFQPSVNHLVIYCCTYMGYHTCFMVLGRKRHEVWNCASKEVKNTNICCILAALPDRLEQLKCFQQLELSSLLKQGCGLINRAHIQTVEIKKTKLCVIFWLLFVIGCIFYLMADEQAKAQLALFHSPVVLAFHIQMSRSYWTTLTMLECDAYKEITQSFLLQHP